MSKFKINERVYAYIHLYEGEYLLIGVITEIIRKPKMTEYVVKNEFLWSIKTKDKSIDLKDCLFITCGELELKKYE